MSKLKQTHSTNAPRLESWIARIGIFGVAGLSAYIGFQFWQARGDEVSAFLTVFCELVALGGMALVIHHRGRLWLAVGAFVVTAFSAGWCGLTMFQKLSSEAHGRALEAVEATAAYVQAKDDLSYATALYRAALAARSDAPGPLTTQARTAEIAATRSALRAERDAAQVRLDALTPKPTLDVIAIVRGAGIEISKLLGLLVFGFGIGDREIVKPGAALANQRWKKKSAKRKPSLRVVV